MSERKVTSPSPEEMLARTTPEGNVDKQSCGHTALFPEHQALTGPAHGLRRATEPGPSWAPEGKEKQEMLTGHPAVTPGAPLNSAVLAPISVPMSHSRALSRTCERHRKTPFPRCGACGEHPHLSGPVSLGIPLLPENTQNLPPTTQADHHGRRKGHEEEASGSAHPADKHPGAVGGGGRGRSGGVHSHWPYSCPPHGPAHTCRAAGGAPREPAA